MAHSARNPEAGVTLVEVLVVLVLISVVAGAVGLGIGSLDRGDALGREADLLTARLNRAADEALVGGAAVAVLWDATRYRFAVLGPAGWAPHPLPLLAEAHPLPTSLRLEGAGDGRFVVTADLLPESGAPLRLALSDGRQSETVVFDGVNATREPVQ